MPVLTNDAWNDLLITGFGFDSGADCKTISANVQRPFNVASEAVVVGSIYIPIMFFNRFRSFTWMAFPENIASELEMSKALVCEHMANGG
jgi:hypothetical protein